MVPRTGEIFVTVAPYHDTVHHFHPPPRRASLNPAFVNSFVPVVLTDSKGRRATFQVAVDCFTIGTDDDLLRVALSG